MIKNLEDYYRLPADLLGGLAWDGESGNDGFFRCGPNLIGFGKSRSGVAAQFDAATLPDAANEVRSAGSNVWLPFSADRVIDNLRLEHYMRTPTPEKGRMVNHALVRAAYYFVRELLPVAVRRHLQRAYMADWKKLPFPRWPVDFTVDDLHEELLRLLMEANGLQKIPFIWFWPNGAPSCLIMTHDVEQAAGRNFASQLMDWDASRSIPSSFQVVPEKRYEIPDEFVQEVRTRGFELNVHDLNHDGHLFEERTEFLRRAAKINGYADKYGARGFRAGAMYRNQDWYDAFKFSYDMSVPDVAHLEPQRGGCCTVMPYFVGEILELPLTTTQDYSILHILDDHSIGLWKTQVDAIRQRYGLMSFNAHPDYLTDRSGRELYESLLDFLAETSSREKIWKALPGEVDRWWRTRSRLRLVPRGEGWEIEGPGKEQACLAYAVLGDSGRLRYEVSTSAN